MSRQPHPDSLSSGRQVFGNGGAFFQDYRKPPGPEMCHRLPRQGRNLRTKPFHCSDIGDKENEGMAKIAAFHLVDALHRRLICRISQQAIDRIRGRGNNAPAPEYLCRPFQKLRLRIIGVYAKYAGFHDLR